MQINEEKLVSLREDLLSYKPGIIMQVALEAIIYLMPY